MEIKMYLFDPAARIFWLYLLSAFLIVWLWTRQDKFQMRSYFSKAVWWHHSARLDYLLFSLMWGVKVVLLLPLFAFSTTFAAALYAALITQFGYVEQSSLSHLSVALLYTSVLFIANDFTRYWLHRYMHSNQWLWRVHQLHHSAEVLTPLTFYRVHPIENILFGLRYMGVMVMTTAIFWYFFGFQLTVLTLFGSNVTVLFFNLIGANLRHTHLPIHYGWLNYVFTAPLAHQMHHCATYTHKNFGAYLFIWDIMFKSAVLPKSSSKVKKYGLSTGYPQHLKTLLLLPFLKGSV